MEAYKQEFIEFMVDSNVLKFGEFTLKSGRKSPFFMNDDIRINIITKHPYFPCKLFHNPYIPH